MRRLNLIRKYQSDQGTFGVLVGSGLSLYTAELPERGNQQDISRIPAGIYLCAPYSSKKFPNVFQVLEVPGREAILIHVGNFAGDKSLGYLSDVNGCILVGEASGSLTGQRAVLDSGQGMNALRYWVGKENFELCITENWQVN